MSCAGLKRLHSDQFAGEVALKNIAGLCQDKKRTVGEKGSMLTVNIVCFSCHASLVPETWYHRAREIVPNTVKPSESVSLRSELLAHVPHAGTEL